MQVVVFCKNVLILPNNDSDFLTLKEAYNLNPFTTIGHWWRIFN